MEGPHLIRVWVLCTLIVAGCLTGHVQAATVSDCANLASAIAAAGSGGTVTIAGILKCSGPTTITSSVTLQGANQNSDGFDGQGLTNLFVIQGSGTQVKFDSLTLTKAKSGTTQGVTVYADSGTTATFSNFIISDGVGDAGIAAAGVFVKGSASFTNGVISGCSSDYAGGAIFADTTGTLSFINVQFKNNVARTGAGGAMYLSGDGQKATFDTVDFDGNSAKTDGGSVFLAGAISSTFSGCTFQNSVSTSGRGGALNAGAGNALTTITNTVFKLNTALLDGGAMFTQSGTSVTKLTNVQFLNNKATRILANGGAPGGALLANGDVSMTGVTMTGNTATTSGGAMYSLADRVRISGSDIEGNDAYFAGGGVLVQKGAVQIDTTSWHKNSNNTVTGTAGGNEDNGSRDVFVNDGGFAYFCDELPWPGNTNPHTVSGPYSLGCPGYNNTTPIDAPTDCVAFLTALAATPAGGTVTFTNIIRFDAVTCGSFSLPYVISKSVTIQGASDNPLYNTLDAYNNNAFFKVTGAGTRVFLNRLQLTRGVGTDGPAVNVAAGAFIQANNAFFTFCTGTGNGGAIFLASGTPGGSAEILSGSTLTNNAAAQGGAIYAGDGSKLYLYAATLQFNSATGNGGSLWTGGRMDTFFTTWADSTTPGLGGCIYEAKSTYAPYDGSYNKAGFIKNCNGFRGGGIYVDNADATTEFMTWYNGVATSGDSSTNVFVNGPNGILRTCPEPTLFNKPITIVGEYFTTCPQNNPDVSTTCGEFLAAIAAGNPQPYSYDPSKDPAVPTIRFAGNIELTANACPSGTTFPIEIGGNVQNLRFLGDDANPQFNTLTGKTLNSLFKVTNPNGVKFERLWMTLATKASGNGACIEHTAGPLTLTNVNLQDCIAQNGNGGGVFLGAGTSGSTVSFAALRSFAQFGGSVYTSPSVPVVSSGSGFFQGGAYQSGGGLYVQGPFSATFSSVTSNSAGAAGAGLFAAGAADVLWTTGSYDSNTATTEGGALYMGASTKFKGQFYTNANNQVKNQPKNPTTGQRTSAAGYLDTGALVTICGYTGQSSDQGNEKALDAQFFNGPGIGGLTLFANQDCTNLQTSLNPPPHAQPPPVSANPPPVAKNPPPSTANPPPVPANPPPVSANPPPVTANPPPVSANPPPVSANPPPVSANPTPASANPPPRSTTGSPVFANPPPNSQPPPLAVNPPPVANQPPPVSANPPPVSLNPPPVSGNPPPVTANPPPVAYQPPPVSVNPSPASLNPPPVSANPPPISANPPPLSLNPPPVSANPPPVTANPPPVSTNPSPVSANPPPQSSTSSPVFGNPPPVSANPPLNSQPPPLTINPPPVANQPPPISANPPASPPLEAKQPPPISVNPPPVTANPPLAANPPPVSESAANPPPAADQAPPTDTSSPPLPANQPPPLASNPGPVLANPPPYQTSFSSPPPEAAAGINPPGATTNPPGATAGNLPPFPRNVYCDPLSVFKYTCFNAAGSSSICCDSPCPNIPASEAYCVGQPVPTAAGPTPPPTACDPNADLRYTCYNDIGSSFICCASPCVGTPTSNPQCPGQPITPAAPTACDPTAIFSNTCYNAPGSSFVCCASPCPNKPAEVPFCSAQPIVQLAELPGGLPPGTDAPGATTGAPAPVTDCVLPAACCNGRGTGHR